MLARAAVTALALALVAAGFWAGAASLPGLSFAESRATEAPVGAVSAIEDTCPLLGRQQPGQGCDGAAAPAVAVGLGDTLQRFLDQMHAYIDLLRQEVEATAANAAPELTLDPGAGSLPAAAPEPSRARVEPAAARTDGPVEDAAEALTQAIQDQVQSQIEQALAAQEPSAARLGGGAHGCTTRQEAGDGWTRTSVQCVQQQVSSHSTSSVQTSSSSLSVSTTSSTDSR
jgi:hypothetical protein